MSKHTYPGAEYIDIRDVIERIEDLELEVEDAPGDAEAADELKDLMALMDELAGNGGDERWRGAWYPVSLICEDNFEDYARQLADDIGAVKSGAEWPGRHIDWAAAADELKQDYSAVEYGGTTYYYR